MRPAYLLCLLMTLLSLGKGVHAQAYPCSGAGPGETVVGESPAGNGVGSVPLCQRVDRGSVAPQLPPPKWESRWGAVAIDVPSGSLGTATNLSSKRQAVKAALTDCQSKHGSTTCKIDLSYSNQCAAMVVGGKIYNVNPGATMDEAIQTGMNMCRTAASDCHVYYSACSSAQRIQ